MKGSLPRLIERFDLLSLRERVMVSLALLGSVLLIAWAAFLDPAWAQFKGAERTILAQQAQIQLLNSQVAALNSPDRSPEKVARQELDALKQQLSATGERLAALETVLVAPQRMSALLEAMIGGSSTGLRLISLRTLPVTSVIEKKESGKDEGGRSHADKSKERGAPAEGGGLYKHGVELKLEGNYADLTDYLARLEKLPQKLLWSSVLLSAEKHPKLVLTLTVYTLSLDRAWLAF